MTRSTESAPRIDAETMAAALKAARRERAKAASALFSSLFAAASTVAPQSNKAPASRPALSPVKAAG